MADENKLKKMGVPLDIAAEMLGTEESQVFKSLKTSAKYFNNPLTVDIVIEYYDNSEFKGIVLIKRKCPPYQGFFALPGGFVDLDEPEIPGFENLGLVETAVIREAKEETGLDVDIQQLIGVYSRRGRDPRGPTISVAYLAKAEGTLHAGDDASYAEVHPYGSLPELAFDHSQIIEYAKAQRDRE